MHKTLELLEYLWRHEWFLEMLLKQSVFADSMRIERHFPMQYLIGGLTVTILWSSKAEWKNWRFYCDKRSCESVGLPLAVAVTSSLYDRRVCKNLSLTIYCFEKRRYKIQWHHRHSRGERWVSRHVTYELSFFLCLVTWGRRQRRCSIKKMSPPNSNNYFDN